MAKTLGFETVWLGTINCDFLLKTLISASPSVIKQT